MAHPLEQLEGTMPADRPRETGAAVRSRRRQREAWRRRVIDRRPLAATLVAWLAGAAALYLGQQADGDAVRVLAAVVAALGIGVLPVPLAAALQRRTVAAAVVVATWSVDRARRDWAALDGGVAPNEPWEALERLGLRADDVAMQQRITWLVEAGDLPRARAELDRWEPASPSAVAARTRRREVIEFVETGADGLAAVRAAGAAIDDEMRRTEFEVAVDLEEAFRRALAGASPWPPLRAARSRLERAGLADPSIERTARRRVVPGILVGAAVFAFALVFRGLDATGAFLATVAFITLLGMGLSIVDGSFLAAQKPWRPYGIEPALEPDETLARQFAAYPTRLQRLRSILIGGGSAGAVLLVAVLWILYTRGIVSEPTFWLVFGLTFAAVVLVFFPIRMTLIDRALRREYAPALEMTLVARTSTRGAAEIPEPEREIPLATIAALARGDVAGAAALVDGWRPASPEGTASRAIAAYRLAPPETAAASLAEARAAVAKVTDPAAHVALAASLAVQEARRAAWRGSDGVALLARARRETAASALDAPLSAAMWSRRQSLVAAWALSIAAAVGVTVMFWPR